jgi:hypothetical protein
MGAQAEFVVEAPQENHGLVRKPDSMLSIIERAVSSPDFDVNKLSALLEVRERWERNEARKAFVSAMNAFKADPPEISKNKHVKIARKDGTGFVEYDHATLDHVCDAITQGLSKHGISHRWSINDTDKEWIVVTCILTHDLGHFEETSMRGCADQTGNKNALQARSSTVTYLQRYTLLSATGLAASNGDDDGAGGAGPRYPDLAERLEWIQNSSTLPELEKIFKAAYKEASAIKDVAAMKRLVVAKDERKAEIS